MHRNVEYSWYFLVILFFTGLLYAPFLQSISLILWMLFGIYHIGVGRSRWKTHIAQFLQSGPWLWITVFFLIAFFGGFYSVHFDPWLDRIRIKLPCLVVPFFVFAQVRFSKSVLLNTYGIFVVLLTVSSSFVLLDVLLHFSSYIENLASGIPVDTGIHHGRYSLLVAIACIACFYWGEKISKIQRHFAFGIGIYLFIFLHVIAVRSGLLTFYGCLLFWSIWHLIKHRRFANWTVVLLFPVVAYFMLPGFKARLAFMWKDINRQEKSEQTVDFSDRNRILSWQLGYEVFKSAPLFGVGTGDLRPLMRDIYSDKYLRSDFLMPHNQWLSILAAHGVIGFVFFNLALWKIWRFFWRRRDPLAISFCLIYGASMLVENSMETAIGVAIFIFFVTIHLLLSPSSHQA